MRIINEQTAYENLANEIIIRAVKDYRRLYKVYLKYPYNDVAYKQIKKLERFFRSDYFCVLSNLDGEKLIEKIQNHIRRKEL